MAIVVSAGAARADAGDRTDRSPAPSQPPQDDSRSRSLRRRRVRDGVRAYLYIVPMMALVGTFLVFPAVQTVWLAFTDADGLKRPQFIGFGNFVSLSKDPAFLGSVGNTAIWVVGILVVQVGLGLLIAVALNKSFLAELPKRIIYLPATISGTAVGICWYFVFNPELGIVNNALKAVGLADLAQAWLTTPVLNTLSMIIASVWQGLGPTVILFLVGLENIPREPVEAAMIDGASGLRMFRSITLPLLRPMTMIVVALSLVGSFKVFDIIWVMTRGGPYRSSETLAVTMYRETFVSYNLGAGAAVAVLLTAVTFSISLVYIRRMFRIEDE